VEALLTSSFVIYSFMVSMDVLSVVSGMTVVNIATVTAITLWTTGFLCLLNVGFAMFYRDRKKQELISYLAACAIELAVFVFALLFQLRVIAHVPYHLPPGLPVNRAEIGAALAFGIGLFPVGYWHRINVSDLPKRIADDAQVIKDRDGGVHVRKGIPGEWMN
jgi:hypothetical protein